MKNRNLRKSFQCAFRGVGEALRDERNVRFHLSATVLVVAGGLIFRVDGLRWAILFGLCGLVIASELLNTALETLVNMVTGQVCDEARKVKDMAAGAVFVTAFFSVLGGIAVFWQPFWRTIELWTMKE